VIAISHKKHMVREESQVKILKKEILKLLIFRSLMGIPTHLICFQNFFLSFQVHWKEIENLVSFMVTYLECLLHLQNVYLQCRMHN
jgi:hypothetical protein